MKSECPHYSSNLFLPMKNRQSNMYIFIDLGEIMRFVTNMVSKGRSEYNLQARNVLQLMYNAYFQINPYVHRELNKKIHQHKGSMLKVMS